MATFADDEFEAAASEPDDRQVDDLGSWRPTLWRIEVRPRTGDAYVLDEFTGIGTIDPNHLLMTLSDELHRGDLVLAEACLPDMTRRVSCRWPFYLPVAEEMLACGDFDWDITDDDLCYSRRSVRHLSRWLCVDVAQYQNDLEGPWLRFAREITDSGPAPWLVLLGRHEVRIRRSARTGMF